jgi:hypothetical protein
MTSVAPLVSHDRGVDRRDARIVQQVDRDLLPRGLAPQPCLRQTCERDRRSLEGGGVEFEAALGIVENDVHEDQTEFNLYSAADGTTKGATCAK